MKISTDFVSFEMFWFLLGEEHYCCKWVPYITSLDKLSFDWFNFKAAIDNDNNHRSIETSQAQSRDDMMTSSPRVDWPPTSHINIQISPSDMLIKSLTMYSSIDIRYIDTITPNDNIDTISQIIQIQSLLNY